MNTGRRGVWGWMAFDWASQPFNTVITTFVFGPYFAARVAEDAVAGQALWGYAVAAGSVLMALAAPVLGSIADAQGPRKPWILAFSALYL
ncbi:MAG: MFS transporter, partial [Alphaproteobacteria bacterium]|nr:MFS transporter [Alphaproteobacteria bacterium]MCY4320055.1 MFS transporter [Alphaproteobacteria bacterium]